MQINYGPIANHTRPSKRVGVFHCEIPKHHTCVASRLAGIVTLADTRGSCAFSKLIRAEFQLIRKVRKYGENRRQNYHKSHTTFFLLQILFN